MTDDEALETLFAMANVQDGYAKKATDPGLKVIHKANAKAQREVAAVISDLRAERDALMEAVQANLLRPDNMRAALAIADRDRLAAANAALEAQVGALREAGDALDAACVKAIGLRKHPAWPTIREWRRRAALASAQGGAK